MARLQGPKWMRPPPFKLTLFGRSYLIVGTLLLVNLISWIAALALFASDPVKRKVLALCTVAWTLGLRHALDADHISAIDNATRQLVAKGQRPLTCGLFFSLGHSTIVISVTVAIAVATSVANRLDGVSKIGGVVGISVSAAFLFLLGCINSYILYRILRERRRQKAGLVNEDEPKQGYGCIARAVLPLLRLIDKPWKLYPIGILFGFGFDTASEIALLGVTAIATTAAGGGIASSEILILPVLFTSGMSLVDTIDSVLMLWGYAMPEPGEERWNVLFTKRQTAMATSDATVVVPESVTSPPMLPVTARAEGHPLPVLESDEEPGSEIVVEKSQDVKDLDTMHVDDEKEQINADSSDPEPALKNKQLPPKRKVPSVHSDLSIALTIISIFVAFAISIIEFMGIALEECKSCAEAAESDPGLSGRWWRFWGTMNDNSGYIGAAIVGVMLFCMVVFLLGRRYQRKRAARTRTNTTAAPQETASHGAETKVSTDEAVGELKEDV